MRQRVAGLVAGAIVLAAAGVAGWVLLVRSSPDPREQAAAVADRYLDAWEAEDWPALASLVREPPSDLVDRHRELWEELEVTAADLQRGPVTLERARATTPVEVSLTLAGDRTWSYQTTLVLDRREGEFAVTWGPATLHPGLDGQVRLDRRDVWPDRAPILAHDGTPLTRQGTAYQVGIEPRRVQNPAQVAEAFATHTGVPAERVRRLLDRDDLRPDWFYPVVRLREDAYRQARPALHPVPGIVFRATTTRLTPTEDFAAHVLGEVDEITAELLEELGSPYAVGDTVGISGLERVFEERLAGAPTTRIVVVGPDGAEGAVVAELGGRKPEPVRTTLDAGIQAAAEQAVAGVEQPVGFVAVSPATGAVRAAVSRPLDEFGRALAGLYPPGSTFKVVTAAAALDAGLTPDSTHPCPAETIVGGLHLRNAGGLDLGEVTLREAFARSCNTTFGPLGAELPPNALELAATTFGFGASHDLPLPTSGGRFPEPADRAARAAAAIGQARVQASPLHMATVAAAVASGTWRAPHLLTGEAGGATQDLPAEVAPALADLMRTVVASGTGTAASVPGPPVAGKTGSAEFGSGDPPPTHAWFIGFRGPLAFAVVVDGGGSGGEVAAPLAARFLTALDAEG